MNLERMFDRKFFGYRSVLGYYHWLGAVKNIIKNKHTPFTDKLWCLNHGFTIEYYNYLGHDNLRTNYQYYLSPRQYFKLHPINGMFSLWIDDKLTVKHVFSHYGDFFPRYYFDIEDGEALKLPDCPDTVSANGYQGVLELLRLEKKLALKQLLGRFGIGFYRLEYQNGEYYITGKKSSEDEIIQLLKSLNYYIVTEFITNHETLYKVWPGSTNTLRLLIASIEHEPVLLRSFIRFGNAKSNGVDNAHSGGLVAVINEDTGRVDYTVAMDDQGYATKLTEHPDSGVSFDIQIPRWEEIVSTCMDICRSYPELRYLGFDVVITPDGFKFLEINSLSGVMVVQLGKPMLKDPKTKKAFQSFGLRTK